MIQKQVQFHRSLAGAVFGPVVYALAQVYDGGIEAHELVFEPELALFARGCPAAGLQHLVEKVLVELPRPIGVGVGEGGAFVGLADL